MLVYVRKVQITQEDKNVVSPRNKVTLSPVLCSYIFVQVLGHYKLSGKFIFRKIILK
jgi:hypothetical protein